MKVEQTNPEPQFRPVIITLECQDEVDAITTLLNSGPILKVFPCLDGYYKEFSRLGDYNKKWWELVRIIKS